MVHVVPAASSANGTASGVWADMGLGTVIASILSIVLAVALVIGLAFAGLYALRRWQNRADAALGGAADRAPGLRFIRALPLGQGERLVLVEVGDQLLLLGVAGHAVTLIDRVDRTAAEAPEATRDPADPAMPLPRPDPSSLAALRDAAAGLGQRWRADR